ncbi:glyoxylase-related zinc-dependent hydrolase [Citrifermentans bemidjiense Bem]|uniref:Glyoxylase-related zinc-dependent hydrolase n=1 Tax=Citrifermentans bemidjiense (strain ATCC BAA-1014 / DSM 16622 / JCM 12645 / Bem) TaxID=404380 RepID=B5E904_CITBB|nr:MBL fold metallo-hydrolase [Citrifermentans bemidjiense]ACH40168.1 glyoxylase-related zinc-dependent hydrolase [Citrifermentans bemidjiense Bem]
MKKTAALAALSALVLTLLFVNSACAELTKISNNVYSYVGVKDASPGNSFAANAGIVIGRDGVLVVDTLISAKEGKRFLADIRKVTNKPIKYVVNTHTHLDHALGNCVFANLGAAIISHQAERASLEANGPLMLRNIGSKGLKPEDVAGTEVVLPNLAFSDQMLIDLGGEEIRLIRLSPSHTAGSIVVYLPTQKILFSGDILFTDFHPFLADGDFKGWIGSIDKLLDMEIDGIIPGHGPLSTKKDLRDMKNYIVLFDKRARELATKSQDSQVISAQLLKELPKRSMAEWMVNYNVLSRYIGKN